MIIIMIELPVIYTYKAQFRLNRVGLNMSDINNTSLLCEKGFYGDNDYHCRNHIEINKTKKVKKKDIYTIAFYGDSLISQTNIEHNLSNRLKEKLNSTYTNLLFDVIVCANGALKAKDLLKNINNCLALHPHSLIILWDTDIKPLWSGNETYKVEYIHDVSKFLETTKKTIANIAMAGPVTYGELPKGQNLYDDMLDLHRNLNKNISYTYNILYIDIRKELFKKISQRNAFIYPLHRGSHGMCGYLTEDGTHPNKLGTSIYVELFYNQIKRFYNIK